MCNAFHVDADNVIASCPIITTGETYEYLAVEGIILPLLPEEPGGNFICPIDGKGIVFPNGDTDDYDYDDPYVGL